MRDTDPANPRLPLPGTPGNEFPADFFEITRDAVSRRRMLQLMGASLLLAGLGGCSDKPPDARIVPYVNRPESIIPGKPLFFATTMPFDGYGRGVLVASREGRPIKVEGNPDHPASLGGTDVFAQASVLGLYDPDRAKTVARAGNPSTWGAFHDAVQQRLARKGHDGRGLRFLCEPTTSPTLLAQVDEFAARFPSARWHWWSPTARRNSAAGLRAAFGRPLSARYDFSSAKVVVCLDADFLFDDPAGPRYARQFTDGRRVRRDRPEMNRLYVAESALSLTGSMADHRVGLRPARVAAVARSLAARCGVSGVSPDVQGDAAAGDWLRAAAADLLARRGASLVVAGESQPPEVHALAHALNHALGNTGRTITYTGPVDSLAANPDATLEALVSDLRAGAVDTLIILGGNPAYAAPAALGFADELAKLSTARDPDGSLATLTAHLADHPDETSFLCQWSLPAAHYLETWGDARAFDGTASLLQPLIAPLYDGLSAIELLERLLGRPDRSAYEVVRGHWSTHHGGGDFEPWWRAALKTGVIPDTAFAAVNVPAPSVPQGAPPATAPSAPDGAEDLDVVFRPDYTVWDGRFANNPWLQELPKPFTKLTWDNAALVGPKTAERLGLADEQVVTLSLRGRSIEAPVLVVPGTPDGLVCVSLGYGRTRGGAVCTADSDGDNDADDGPRRPRGYDANLLRPPDGPWAASGARLAKTARTYALVTTRSHHAMANLEGFRRDIENDRLKPDAVVTPATPADERELSNRRIVRVVSLQQFRANPRCVKDLGGEKEKKPLLSLYPGPEHGGWDYSHGYQWGMSIDLTACIGCNACVIACQAENNIPVVGKDQVARQREMHWIRIDDYFAGPLDDPAVYHQPVPCMHCENAPCEYVCPTGATTHSAEGLNQMTYNRCVGTRYCSNNCPYKVRRFNFLAYADAETTEQRKLQRNPEVTVRTNGVMEKCTYCVQRIQHTRIEAEKARVDLLERARAAATPEERDRLTAEADRREYELVARLQSACQQACPSRAIEFGSVRPVAGRSTPVAALKEQPHDYSLLHELTTRPRTTYLARVVNPAAPAAAAGGGAA
jgi:molybdopterin-containing oxidoreductase family iron-sulfur binding subunit